MRELDGQKISCKSTPRLIEEIAVFVARAKSRGVTANGAPLTREALINALLGAFFTWPVDRQMEHLKVAIAIYERYMAGADFHAAADVAGDVEGLDRREAEIKPRQ